MDNMIIVYFGQDLLPYKDKELQVHFPIVGSSFQFASQTTQIKFYITNILRNESSIWLAVSKLPNGQVGYTKLDTQEDDDGTYVLLSLTRWHTQYKGDLYVNLQCYDGGVEFEENDQEILVPTGVPVVMVSGSIKLAINYSTGIIDGGDVDVHTLQELLAYFANYLRKDSSKYLKVVDLIANVNTTEYKDYLNSGDIVYSVGDKAFYVLSGTYPHYGSTIIPLELDTAYIDSIIAENIQVNDKLRVAGFDDIINGSDTTLMEYIANQIATSSAYVYSMETSSVDLNTTLYQLLTDNHNIRIKYAGDLYDKVIVGESTDTYICTRDIYTESSGAYNKRVRAIILNHSLKRLNYGEQTQITIYSKSQMDALLNLKADKSDTYTKSEIDTKLTSMLVYKGTKTVAELNALAPSLSSIQTGWFYNVSDSGTLTAGSVEVLAGDNVAWTGSSWDKLTMDLSVYDDKFIAAGFFEVQNYNTSTGEITFVYSSDLYDMSYNSSTGILTIEAN